ncbi:hypothetical protein GQ55_1G306500 [Panicum hallii var. hallii]|uniref:C2H2-type domain-containing protein n=1 Tax=Panicum hallii var. hallii TaxID=1504633 RepID=A0A2T7F988_9POAL|nr:hypothetical protein GQ55_1G306500 [Panicum hallii var. hallii]PUZ76637.1 hypothetical protein GQ55_1G306500 [Panicum hallii var. hallii]
MDSNEICTRPHELEKLEIARRGEEDKASYNPELEEGEFRKDEPFVFKKLVRKDVVASTAVKLPSSAQVAIKNGQVNTRRPTSPERGSHQGGIANTVMQSKYRSIRDQPDNVRQSSSHRIYSEKYRQSYSLSPYIRSKEKHEQRTRNCFSYHDYHHVLKKIEEVCLERLGKLLLHQNKDRKEFNITLKKLEFKCFQEHACSYRVHYERVIPTARYHRMKLPKLTFCILRKVFRRYMQSQIIKFVKQQINDRNKEKRIKERWRFEATAGYLKKSFDETSLAYSGFEMEKSNYHMHAYSEGEQQLKYLDMQPLTIEIEEIASSRELEGSHTNKESDVFDPEPVIENLQSPLEANGGAEHHLSVDAPEEIAIVDSMSSQSNYAPTMESEKVGTQVILSSPPQNKEEIMERSCSQFATDEALVLDNATSADSESAPPVFGENQSCISPAVDASEGSCSMCQRKFPHGSDSNIHESTLHHEEPQVGRLPSVNVDEMEEADIAGSKEVSSGDTSSSGQVTEQRSTIATSSTLVQPSTQPQLYDPTCQSSSYPYQPSGVNTCSVSTGLDSHGALNAQMQSANQTTSSSMVEHMPESGLQSDPVTNEFSQLLMSISNHTSSSAQVTEQQIASNSFLRQQYGDQACQTSAHQHRASNVQRQSNNQTTTGFTSGLPESHLQSDPLTIEMSQLLVLHDLMTKRHLSKRQKIILEREIEMAELKRKFDEQFHNLEMETLQKKKDIEILQEKICKQQILAETFQVLHKASTGVASCSQIGPLPANRAEGALGVGSTGKKNQEKILGTGEGEAQGCAAAEAPGHGVPIVQ